MTATQLAENCIQRTARKHYRCTCADEVLAWRAIGYYDGGRSYSSRRFATEVEARSHPRLQAGGVAAVDGRPGSPTYGEPTRFYERVEIEPVKNPDYRSDCSIDIRPGDPYVEYVGESAPYESGSRYCQPCGVAVWGQDV